MACDFVQHDIQLPTFHNASMPNYPNFRLGTGEPVCDPNITTAVFQPVLIETAPKIYPNPADDYIMIDFKFTGEPCYFYLYNALGQVVLTHSLERNQDLQEVKLPEIGNGIYFYAIQQNGKSINLDRVVIRK